MAKVNLEVGKTINITVDIKAVVLKKVFELMRTCSKGNRCVYSGVCIQVCVRNVFFLLLLWSFTCVL